MSSESKLLSLLRVNLQLSKSGEGIERRQPLTSDQGLKNVFLLGQRKFIGYGYFVQFPVIDHHPWLAVPIDNESWGGPGTLGRFYHPQLNPLIHLFIYYFPLRRGGRKGRKGNRLGARY